MVPPTLLSTEKVDPQHLSIDPAWANFLATFFSTNQLPNSPLKAIFEPIRALSRDSMLVVGQIGQTLDGRIATHTGQSKYINGPAGLVHIHQLRALFDAVIVGVGTVLADDPLLTVRLVPGRHPARVVIDPRGRMGPQMRIWNDDQVRKIWVVANGTQVTPPPHTELLTLPSKDGRIEPTEILQGLMDLGFRRILVEGGADTLSNFIHANCLDRIHMIVAPIIMGSGRSSFKLPAIEHMDQALRLNVQTHLLGNEVLFDCDLKNVTTKIT